MGFSPADLSERTGEVPSAHEVRYVTDKTVREAVRAKHFPLCHAFRQTSIGAFRLSMHCCTHIIKNGKYSGRSSPFNQITNNFIVEELNFFPFDSFSNIFFLFSLQRKSKQITRVDVT